MTCLVRKNLANTAVAMAEEDLADEYQMLEELGSTYLVAFCKRALSADWSIGGSFGIVYKAIEKSTGEIVAIKHVRF